MRSVLALTVVLFTQILVAAEVPTARWLVAHSDDVQVLHNTANLRQILNEIELAEGASVLQLVTTDHCARNLIGEGIRCSLILNKKYLIQYRVLEENGSLKILEPVRFNIFNN